MKRSVAVGLIFVLAVACEDEDEVISAALLSAPSGLAMAGRNFDKLFIANSAEDALRVLDVASGIGQADFIVAPSVFNPLRIPVGPNPSDIIASDDGRVVVVLDPIGEALRLVQADERLVVRDEADEVYVFPLGPSGSLPVDLEDDPMRCDAPCVGGFFASLSAAGEILELRILDESNDEEPPRYRIGLSRIYAIGGRPQRIAASLDGRWLFVTDAASDEVVRIDRQSGESERREVGASPSDIAVSGDGTALLVARPGFRDLLIFENISGTWDQLAADSRLAPPLSCLSECSELDEACIGAHPASRQVCLDEAGDLTASAESYDALFLGVIPRRLITFSVERGQRPLVVSCAVGSGAGAVEESRLIDEYAIVISESNFGRSSSTRWVALRDRVGEDASPLDPRIVENGDCEPSAIQLGFPPLRFIDREDGSGERLDRSAALGDFLTECPEVPDLRRFECLNPVEDGEVVDDSVGVVVASGQLQGNVEWRLEWEGRFLNRRGAQGTLLVGGRVLSDEDLDLAENQVRVNDIVRVLTRPRLLDDGCVAALGSTRGTADACNFERRVIGLRSAEALGREFGGLLLDGDPLPLACFSGDRAVSYEVRAGDSFVVGRSDQANVGRVGIGERFGPGGESGQQSGISFAIRDDLLGDVDERDACVRYQEGNPNRSPQIVRDQAFRFIVRDSTLVQQPGRLIRRQVPSSAAGASPSGAIVAEAPIGVGDDRTQVDNDSALVRLPYLFVTFEATDSLVIFRPDAPLSIRNPGNTPNNNYRLIR